AQAGDTLGWSQIARSVSFRDPLGIKAVKKASIVLVATALCAVSGLAHAQGSYPNRPITMVVPLPAGGTADLLCRLAAERAGAALKQQAVTEDRRGGAGGRDAIEAVM